jgi:hypothetical protein
MKGGIRFVLITTTNWRLWSARYETQISRDPTNFHRVHQSLLPFSSRSMVWFSDPEVFLRWDTFRITTPSKASKDF